MAQEVVLEAAESPLGYPGLDLGTLFVILSQMVPCEEERKERGKWTPSKPIFKQWKRLVTDSIGTAA